MESSRAQEDRDVAMAALCLFRLKDASPKDPLPLPPGMPPVPTLRGLVGRCSEPFTKKLATTDLDRCQNRLMLWKADVQRHVLPLLSLNRSTTAEGVRGLPVKVYSTAGREYDMEFNVWSRGKSPVINRRWMNFVRDMELDRGELRTLTIWAFLDAVSGRLCFLISPDRTTSDVGSNGSSSMIHPYS